MFAQSCPTVSRLLAPTRTGATCGDAGEGRGLFGTLCVLSSVIFRIGGAKDVSQRRSSNVVDIHAHLEDQAKSSMEVSVAESHLKASTTSRSMVRAVDSKSLRSDFLQNKSIQTSEISWRGVTTTFQQSQRHHGDVVFVRDTRKTRFEAVRQRAFVQKLVVFCSTTYLKTPLRPASSQ